MGDFLAFRKMIVPVIIQIVFWLGIIACIIAGIGSIVAGVLGYGEKVGMILGGILSIFLGPIIVRVYCEFVMVVFKMYDTVREIKDTLIRQEKAGPKIY